VCAARRFFMSHRVSPAASAVVFALLLLALSAGASAPQEPLIVRIAAIGDLHGHLRPPPEGLRLADGTTLAAGGVARLATAVQRMRAESRHFAFVSAGDLVGASPLLSAWFDDEPVFEAMNLMGLDFNGIGNHEFDHGVGHLRRLVEGGCPESGCRSGQAYAGARFPILAANVIVRATGKALFAPYAVREFDGVKVAFIGVTLRATPVILSPRAVEGLEFRDEAQAVNALVPGLKQQGIEAIVVLMHQGGYTKGGYNECVNFSGPVTGIVEQLDPAVDVVVSAHTHQAYLCRVGGRLVTSAGPYGRLVTDIELRIDRGSRDVVSATAVNRAVGPDLPEDGAQAALVARYAALAAPLARVVGRVSATISRRMSPDGESAMGKLIADSQLDATKEAGAAVAFMNPGGVRAPLQHAGDGTITYADVYAAYPFDNSLVTLTLTGAQIMRLLEQQLGRATTTVLQVSKGFAFSWDPRRPAGSRVVPGSVALDGRALDAGAFYRVTVNSFNWGGGDGLTVLREGRDVVRGGLARDALERYVARHAPVAPVTDRRARNVSESD
jgi:5'-nucleotidase